MWPLGHGAHWGNAAANSHDAALLGWLRTQPGTAAPSLSTGTALPPAEAWGEGGFRKPHVNQSRRHKRPVLESVLVPWMVRPKRRITERKGPT